MDIVRFFAYGPFAIVLVAGVMARFVGVVACTAALLFPGWAGLRSATSPPHHAAYLAPPLTPQVSAQPFVPFVSSHARTSLRDSKDPPFTLARHVLLTFDDGPDLTTTPLVLDELDRHGFKAVFFVAGRRLMGSTRGAVARRKLVQRIVQSGHMVANHTVNHNNLCLDTKQIDYEIDQTQRLIARITGFAPNLFRAPFGSTCAALELALSRRKMTGVGWTIDPQDWRRQSPQQVAVYVTTHLSRMGDRGVVLMHDTHLTGPRALPSILAFIEAERDRAERGQGRAIEVVNPTVLLPPDNLPAAYFEPLARDLSRNLASLPELLGLAELTHP